MYFRFSKLQDWGERSAAVRRRNYAVLPLTISHFPLRISRLFPGGIFLLAGRFFPMGYCINSGFLI